MMLLDALLLLLLAGISTTTGYNSYLVLCPNGIRPGMEFQVEFSKLSNMSDVRLYGRIFAGDTTVANGDVMVSAARDSAQFKIKLPLSLRADGYQFQVVATDDNRKEIFKNSTVLNFSAKGFSIFIQTDKAIYKPGQKVQFRVFGAKPDLSTINEHMDINIYDPNRNKIAQWLNVTGQDQGVFQGSLQLSDYPPLGEWKIDVEIGDQTETKMFSVDEYVLPKFEVTVTVPSFGVNTDGFLTGTVDAKYTFGKGVRGNGTLNVSRKWSGGQTIEKKFTIDGQYKIEIPLKQMEEVFGKLSGVNTFEVRAEVAEGLTGISRNGTADITYYPTREKLAFLEGSDSFKPGLDYVAYLFVSDRDDKPTGDNNLRVNVTVTMYYDTMSMKPVPDRPRPVVGPDVRIPLPPPPTPAPENKKVEGPKTVIVPKNGLVTISIKIPIYITRVDFEADLNQQKDYKSVQKFQSTTNTYIQVSMETKTAKAGTRATFRIDSTVSGITVKYMIMARRLVVDSGLVKLRNKGTSLKVTLTADMAPSAKIVVYYVRKDAEIIADSIQFSVEGIFQNKVDINFISGRKVIKQTEPAAKVTLRVNADPGSLCNVLTIDKSVLLLKSGNDITYEQVENEILRYDSTSPSPCSSGRVCSLRFFPMPIQAIDASGVFMRSGLAVLTDAFLYESRDTFQDGNIRFEGMPMLMAKQSAGATGNGSGPRVRTLFPETWLFDSAVADSSGKADIPSTVPDTITSWVASAFAVSRRSGLGVAPTPANLEVFLQFFVRLDLPYSVVRGEQVILQADVFNFFTSVIEVEVTLKKSTGFQNIVVRRNASGKTELMFTNQDIVQNIKVSPGGGSAVSFPIKAVELGNIDVEVKVVTIRAGDAIRKPLLVVPEGIPKSYAVPVLIDMRNVSSFQHDVKIYLPDDLVEGSDRISVSVIGDLMGPSISGLTNLLQMPYGCGEQNMITLVPNILVVVYLKAIDKLKPADLEKAQNFMMNGYQREMTYQHFDGSFSAFGNSDPSGSTWLTAFVVKSFAQASPYIFIDPVTVRRAIDWILVQYDNKTGFFREPGRVIHTEMTGGSGTGERNLATYVLIALMTAKENNFFGSDKARMESIIDGGIDSLEAAVDGMENTFELAIASYALLLANSNKLNAVKQKLIKKVTEKDGMMYWENTKEPDSNADGPHSRAQARNIETSAYVLLVYASQNDVTVSLKIVKWLVQQRSPYGGFGSTQDTVIALQGLAVAAALLYSDGVNMDVQLTTFPIRFGQNFKVDSANAQVLQMVDIPKGVTDIKIAANGKGIALAVVSVFYNIMEEPREPKFTLSLQTSDETIIGFNIRVCFRYLGKGVSGMSVLEMGLLSGFEAGPFQISDLNILKRVEGAPTMQIYYFDQVPSDKDTCFTVTMQRVGLVVGSQPAVVRLYDYYEPDDQVTTMYQPQLLKNANVCDLPENGIAECA